MVGKEVTRGEDSYWRRCVSFTRWLGTVHAGAWKRMTGSLRLSLVAGLCLDARSIVVTLDSRDSMLLESYIRFTKRSKLKLRDTKVLGLPSVGNGDWVVDLLSIDGESGGGTFSKILDGLVSAGFRRSKFF